MSAIPVTLAPELSDRAGSLFRHDLFAIRRRVDHMFMALLAFEWVAGIVLALTVSPIVWDGIRSNVHEHVYAAVYLGGVIIAFPLLVAWLLPGSVLSRHAIAIGQLLYSSLLIHLTGGRIETHFHVFGSLAFLAMYRDWRVLITASLIVGIDHIFRGIYWPFSVYSADAASSWRWLEHVTWVAFEDGVLIVAIRQSLDEMRAIATRQAALEEATHRAESADRAKGAFLAQMSHEIRTPMTAILGYADMMAIEGEDSESVHAIRRNGRHLLKVLDDILDLSKIEADQFRVEKTSSDVAEILRDVQQLMGPRASQRLLSLSLEMQNLPPALVTDGVRLRQIVLNLVSNAVKFTETGSVRVVAEFIAAGEQDGLLKIRVVDTGIGLNDDQQSRLFKAFSQADDSHHRLYGGTGLGLVISKRLAMLLGGDIHVESRAGEGSIFSLHLPVEIAATSVLPRPAQLIKSAPPIIPTAAVGRRILIVDDAADNRLLLRKLLVQRGFEVDVAEDGGFAITAVMAANSDEHPYDLVLMDMLMPNMDGYEATRKLRKIGYRGLIFALTAHVSKIDENRCREAGCDDYITKPFDCEALLTRVRSATQSVPRSTVSNLS